MINPCGPLRTALGAYVVGALEPTERVEVAAHLAACPACRDELAVLAGLPGLLGRLNEEEVIASGHLASPSDLLERTLAEIKNGRRHRRRRSRVAAAAAAVAIVVGGGGIAIAVESHHPSQPFSIAGAPAGRISGVNPSTGVRGAATLLSEPWGSAIRLVLSGVAPSEHCQLIAIARNGAHEIAGTWKASYGGTADVPGATAIQPGELAALRVVTAQGAELITLRPTAISQPPRH